MFLKFLHVVFLLGFVKTEMTTTNSSTAYLTTDGTMPLTNSTSPIPTNSSSNNLISTITAVVPTTPGGTTREPTSVTPAASPGETTATLTQTTAEIITTGHPTDPPTAPTAAATTSSARPETNHSTSSETANTATTPGPVSPPVTTSVTNTANTASATNTANTASATNTANTASATNTANTASATHATVTTSATDTHFTTSATNASTTTSNNVSTNTAVAHMTTEAAVTTRNNTVTEAPTSATNNTSPTSNPTTRSSLTSELTTTTAVNSTNTSETPPSTATPSSSTIINTNTSLTTGLPPSSLPPITLPGSTPTHPTGNTTSPSPSTPQVTTIKTTTANGTMTGSPSDTTQTQTSTMPSTDHGTTVTITTLQPTGATTSTTPPIIICPLTPCPVQSVCLNDTCHCLSGSYMKNGRCVPAQVFPGRLYFKLLPFKDQMRDRSSNIFQETAANISAALRNVFKGDKGYVRSDVVQLLPGSVLASVNNIFEDTNATQESVNNAIIKSISSFPGLLSNATYTGTDLCTVEPLACDVSTTSCTNTKGRAVCSCREGYISNIYSNTSCKACPSGQRAEGDACRPCSFGYGGFNCSDSSLLAVVVVSCVLGGILLIIVLFVLFYYCWRKCSCRMPSYNTSPYSDDLNKSWSTAIMTIPRASTNWDAATSIEMTEGGNINVQEQKKPQNNGFSGSYDLDPDDMQTFKGKHSSRYSYLVQGGHENPYFLPGDEKKN